MRILYIEDDDINLFVIEKMLKDHDITPCKTAEMAKEFIQSREFDVVFVDMNLGKSKNEGSELLKEFRALGCTLPIVAMTGYAEHDERQQFMDQGFAEYFTKPINKEKIERYLSSIT